MVYYANMNMLKETTKGAGMKKDKCCICHKPIVGYGNNPWPYEGKKCCDECNLKYVIPKRIKRLDEK